MTGHDAEYSADHRDQGGREIQPRKKSCEMKTDSPIKEKIDDSLDLARFVSRVDLR